MAVKEREVTMHKGDAVAEAAAVVDQAISEESAVEDIKAHIEAQLDSAYEQLRLQQQPEIAEPNLFMFAWDVLAYGPIQPSASGWPGAAPYLPHQIIRSGERAYVASVLAFNPAFTSILTPFKLPYEITYSTGEKKRWERGPASLQHVGQGKLLPNVPYAVDIFSFRADEPGLYEMNICARILDCDHGNTPPFSGFARRVTKFDVNTLNWEPNVTFDTGMLFQVYE